MKAEPNLFIGKLFLTMLLAILISACAAPAPVESPAPPASASAPEMSAQLIIKFTDDQSADQVADKLTRFSRQYMVEFRFIREMSGGAFVIQVLKLSGERHLSALMASLQDRSDVNYVERDSMMMHQSPTHQRSVVQ